MLKTSLAVKIAGGVAAAVVVAGGGVALATSPGTFQTPTVGPSASPGCDEDDPNEQAEANQPSPDANCEEGEKGEANQTGQQGQDGEEGQHGEDGKTGEHEKANQDGKDGQTDDTGDHQGPSPAAH